MRLNILVMSLLKMTNLVKLVVDVIVELLKWQFYEMWPNNLL